MIKKVMITGSNGFLWQHLPAKLYINYDLYKVDCETTKNLVTDRSLAVDIGDMKKASYIFLNKLLYKLCECFIIVIHSLHSTISDSNFYLIKKTYRKKERQLSNSMKRIIKITIYGETE